MARVPVFVALTALLALHGTYAQSGESGMSGGDGGMSGGDSGMSGGDGGASPLFAHVDSRVFCAMVRPGMAMPLQTDTLYATLMVNGQRSVDETVAAVLDNSGGETGTCYINATAMRNNDFATAMNPPRGVVVGGLSGQGPPTVLNAPPTTGATISIIMPNPSNTHALVPRGRGQYVRVMRQDGGVDTEFAATGYDFLLLDGAAGALTETGVTLDIESFSPRAGGLFWTDVGWVSGFAHAPRTSPVQDVRMTDSLRPALRMWNLTNGDEWTFPTMAGAGMAMSAVVASDVEGLVHLAFSGCLNNTDALITPWGSFSGPGGITTGLRCFALLHSYASLTAAFTGTGTSDPPQYVSLDERSASGEVTLVTTTGTDDSKHLTAVIGNSIYSFVAVRGTGLVPTYARHLSVTFSGGGGGDAARIRAASAPSPSLPHMHIAVELSGSHDGSTSGPTAVITDDAGTMVGSLGNPYNADSMVYLIRGDATTGDMQAVQALNGYGRFELESMNSFVVNGDVRVAIGAAVEAQGGDNNVFRVLGGLTVLQPTDQYSQGLYLYLQDTMGSGMFSPSDDPEFYPPTGNNGGSGGSGGGGMSCTSDPVAQCRSSRPPQLAWTCDDPEMPVYDGCGDGYAWVGDYCQMLC